MIDPLSLQALGPIQSNKEPIAITDLAEFVDGYYTVFSFRLNDVHCSLPLLQDRTDPTFYTLGSIYHPNGRCLFCQSDAEGMDPCKTLSTHRHYLLDLFLRHSSERLRWLTRTIKT